MIEGFVLAGAVLGLINGLLARFSLGKVINKSDKIFYSVWLAGMLYRMFFLLASAALLYFFLKNSIIVMAFSLALIFFQFIVEIVPVKHGNKRDS